MTDEADSIDNAQLVGTDGMGTIHILLPPRTRMSRREALVHAAWLVACCEGLDRDGQDARADFLAILDQVRNT